MNWEEYLKELIHVEVSSSGSGLCHVWIGPWRIDTMGVSRREADEFHAEVVERISIVVRKALGEALHVLPHEDPPITDERLNQCRTAIASGHAVVWPSIEQFLDMVEWQNARIAHMATDSGYNEGVKAGEENRDKELYEVISKLEWLWNGNFQGCPECQVSRSGRVHYSTCHLGNWLKDYRDRHKIVEDAT